MKYEDMASGVFFGYTILKMPDGGYLVTGYMYQTMPYPPAMFFASDTVQACCEYIADKLKDVQ